jgi:hypothetical protein
MFPLNFHQWVGRFGLHGGPHQADTGSSATTTHHPQRPRDTDVVSTATIDVAATHSRGEVSPRSSNSACRHGVRHRYVTDLENLKRMI